MILHYLWHLRLWYVNFNKVFFMLKHDLIPFNSQQSHNCKTCMLNKITKTPFKVLLEYLKFLTQYIVNCVTFIIHLHQGIKDMSLLLLMIIPSFVMFFCYIQRMRLSSFQIYKNDVEIQIGSKLKRLRTEGGEYYDPSYFHSMGIILKQSPDMHHNQMEWRKGKVVLYKKW